MSICAPLCPAGSPPPRDSNQPALPSERQLADARGQIDRFVAHGRHAAGYEPGALAAAWTELLVHAPAEIALCELMLQVPWEDPALVQAVLAQLPLLPEATLPGPLLEALQARCMLEMDAPKAPDALLGTVLGVCRAVGGNGDAPPAAPRSPRAVAAASVSTVLAALEAHATRRADERQAQANEAFRTAQEGARKNALQQALAQPKPLGAPRVTGYEEAAGSRRLYTVAIPCPDGTVAEVEVKAHVPHGPGKAKPKVVNERIVAQAENRRSRPAQHEARRRRADEKREERKRKRKRGGQGKQTSEQRKPRRDSQSAQSAHSSHSSHSTLSTVSTHSLSSAQSTGSAQSFHSADSSAASTAAATPLAYGPLESSPVQEQLKAVIERQEALDAATTERETHRASVTAAREALAAAKRGYGQAKRSARTLRDRGLLNKELDKLKATRKALESAKTALDGAHQKVDAATSNLEQAKAAVGALRMRRSFNQDPRVLRFVETVDRLAEAQARIEAETSVQHVAGPAAAAEAHTYVTCMDAATIAELSEQLRAFPAMNDITWAGLTHAAFGQSLIRALRLVMTHFASLGPAKHMVGGYRPVARFLTQLRISQLRPHVSAPNQPGDQALMVAVADRIAMVVAALTSDAERHSDDGNDSDSDGDGDSDSQRIATLEEADAHLTMVSQLADGPICQYMRMPTVKEIRAALRDKPPGHAFYTPDTRDHAVAWLEDQGLPEPLAANPAHRFTVGAFYNNQFQSLLGEHRNGRVQAFLAALTPARDPRGRASRHRVGIAYNRDTGARVLVLEWHDGSFDPDVEPNLKIFVTASPLAFYTHRLLSCATVRRHCVAMMKREREAKRRVDIAMMWRAAGFGLLNAIVYFGLLQFWRSWMRTPDA